MFSFSSKAQWFTSSASCCHKQRQRLCFGHLLVRSRDVTSACAAEMRRKERECGKFSCFLFSLSLSFFQAFSLGSPRTLRMMCLLCTQTQRDRNEKEKMKVAKKKTRDSSNTLFAQLGAIIYLLAPYCRNDEDVAAICHTAPANCSCHG